MTMNGYEFLIARNRLLHRLEDDLAQLAGLPKEEREAQAKRLRARFDLSLAELYAQVASEYPGERRKKARALEDPR